MGSLVSPQLRDRVRAGVEPVARGFGRVGLTPNALTLIGFGIAVVGGVLAAMGYWLVAGLVVGFGAIFDLFDGALARATGRTSRFGAFMDSTFDRAGEAIVYLGILWGCGAAIFPIGIVLAASAMAAAFMVSYVRAKSESLGFTPGTGMANVGLAPREVRTVLLVVGLVVTGIVSVTPSNVIADPGFSPAAAYLSETGRQVMFATLGLITLLATVTTIQRIVHVYLQSKKER
jgi:phosphatidylglycerophosphate synthase